MVDMSLLQDFITEATEHLEEMENSLLALEKDPHSADTLNDIFRAIHTIKGASQFVGLEKISELSHKVENLLDLLRQGERELTPAISDILIDTRDRLAKLTAELQESEEEISDVSDLLDDIKALSLDDEITLDVTSVPVESTGVDSEASVEADLTAALDQSILDDFEPDPEDSLAAVVNDDLISQEISGESFDAELFGIFIRQAKTNFTTVRQLMADFAETEDKKSNHAQCLACLKNMRSSANYMGYIHLTRMFDQWLHALETIEQDIAVDAPVELGLMVNYIEQLLRVLPQIGEGNGDFAPVLPSNTPTLDTSILDDEPGTQKDTAQSSIVEIDDDKLKDELAGEVYDDELFNIFIHQLNNNITSLNLQSQGFAASSYRLEDLDSCAATLANLKSSANYMGYNLLVDLYNNMQLELDAACARHADNQDVDIDFIASYIKRLLGVVPGAVLIADKGQDPAPTSASIDTSIFDDKEESDLFAVLSDSVDTGLDTAPTSCEPLTEIIGEMLSKDDDSTLNDALPKQTSLADKPIASQTDVESINKQILVSKDEVQAVVKSAEERRQAERRKSQGRRPGEDSPRAFKQSIRVDSSKIDSLMNQVGELVVSRAYFSQISSDIRDIQKLLKEQGVDQKSQKPIRELAFKLSEANIALNRVSNELQEGVMKVRMLPVSQLFNRYPRLVRDLTHNTDKQVEIVISGEDTELDKMVIEEISDPLIHIIRNAVDHGIETSAERKASGKPAKGNLHLEAYHESNHIVIEIRDDGRGIDIERVKVKALEKGLISAEEVGRISDVEARRFIMMPGFSTADIATETSGRGVGMDVIKTNIEKLNGTVEIDSQPGVYTQIRIKIPLTLAIIQALMVKVGGALYTISLSVVEETLRVFENEISVIEGVEVIHLRDTTMPIFRLASIFGLSDSKKEDISKSFVIIVSTGMQRIGLVVDELVGQEEVVIKPLVDYLRDNTGFSGATIIGDGRISLILDVYELVKMTSARQVERYKDFAALGTIKSGDNQADTPPIMQ